MKKFFRLKDADMYRFWLNVCLCYGVKIDEVIAKTPKKDSPAEDALPVAGQETQDDFSDENMDIDETQIPQENAEGGENSDEDEFDYSDFELEDEDI